MQGTSSATHSSLNLNHHHPSTVQENPGEVALASGPLHSTEANRSTFEPQADLRYRPLRMLAPPTPSNPSRLTALMTEQGGAANTEEQLSNALSSFSATVATIAEKKLEKRSHPKLPIWKASIPLPFQGISEKHYSNKVLKNIQRLYLTTDDAILVVRRSLIRQLLSPELSSFSIEDTEKLRRVATKLVELTELTTKSITDLINCLNLNVESDTRTEKSARDANFYLEKSNLKVSRTTQFKTAIENLIAGLADEASHEHRMECGKSVRDTFLAATASAAPQDPRETKKFKRHYAKGPHTLRELSPDEHLHCMRVTAVNQERLPQIRSSRHATRKYLTDIKTAAMEFSATHLRDHPPAIGATRTAVSLYEVTPEFQATLDNIVDRGQLVLMEHTLSTFPDAVKFIDAVESTTDKTMIIAAHHQLNQVLSLFYDIKGLGLMDVTPENLHQAHEDQFSVLLFPGGTPAANTLSGEDEGVEKAMISANRGLRNVWYAMQEGQNEVVLSSAKDPIFSKRNRWLGPLEGARRYLISKNMPATMLTAKGEFGWGNIAYSRIRHREESRLANVSHHHLLMKYPLGDFSDAVRKSMPDKPNVLKYLLQIYDHTQAEGSQRPALPAFTKKVKLDIVSYLNAIPAASRPTPNTTAVGQNVTLEHIDQLISNGETHSLIPEQITENAEELRRALEMFEQHRLQIPGAMVYLHSVLTAEERIAGN